MTSLADTFLHLPCLGLLRDEVLEAGDLPSEEGGLISLFLTAVLLFPAAELATLLTPGAVVGLREANETGGKNSQLVKSTTCCISFDQPHVVTYQYT